MLKISDDYEIAQSADHYTLRRRMKTDSDRAKNEYVWKETFHASIEQCCRAIVDKELRNVIDSGLVADFNTNVSKLISAVKGDV